MKKIIIFMIIAAFSLIIYAEEPAPEPVVKNTNVPGEVNNWQLNFSTNFVGVEHLIDATTSTAIGLPLTSTALSAGYQITSQIWIMAKFHLFMVLVDSEASASFLLGPGIKVEFVRTDHISFSGEFFLSLGNEGKIFLFSPEIVLGIDYNLKKYLSIGVFTNFAYQLGAEHVDGGDALLAHWINFTLGPRLTVYF